MRVNGTILFGDKVTPLNLPSCGFDVHSDGESKVFLRFVRKKEFNTQTRVTINFFTVQGTTIGWGVNETDEEELPRELHELDVPLVSLETCQRTYGWLETEGRNGTRTNRSFQVSEDMLCAGGLDGAGAYLFDSGKSK